MTKKLQIELNTAEGKTEKFTTNGLSVRQTFDFYKLQDEIVKKAQSGEGVTVVEGLQKRIEFLASLFEGVTEDMIIDGFEPDIFEDEWNRIMKVIAPQEFDVEDEGK